MHFNSWVTVSRVYADTSADARRYVYDRLLDDASFCGDGGLLGSPACDWFVIGGRWSGELSRLTWAKAVDERITALETERGVQVWGCSYGDAAMRTKQEQLREEVEALYEAALPAEYRGKGLRYDRNLWQELGYEDDAMLVSEELYQAVLAPYKEQWKASDTFWNTLTFLDLDEEAVNWRFIGSKWLVVVDCHT